MKEDVLLLLEHRPTLTLGKSGKLTNLLVDREELARRKISLHFSDRGGDITYHGPGQLVAYPIVDLRRRDKDIHRYVGQLEEAVMGTLADFSIVSEKDNRYVGVWVGKEKICAIGVAVHQWITLHGLALNVDPDLDAFSMINPCGIVGRGVASMTKLKNRTFSMNEVIDRFVANFSRVFSMGMEPGRIDQSRY
jgi:lipoyl synthase